MAQFVKNIVQPYRCRLGHDTVSFLSSVFVVIISAFCGYGLAFLFIPAGDALTLMSTDPYAGCILPVEYALRAAEMCRPVLMETAVVWISAYVDFEKPLLAAVFSMRGISLGISLYAVMLAAESSPLAFLPLAYAAITAVFLIFTRHLRRDVGRVPLTESIVFALLAGGVASAITLVATLLLS